jgi:crossover junction endonuclease MUS81
MVVHLLFLNMKSAYQLQIGQKRLSGDDVPVLPPTKKPRKEKQYTPAIGSGPYALLLALATLDEDSTQELTKTQLIEIAQPLCDSSFTAPSGPSKFHTAWNSMKTLVQKDLIYEHGRPLRKYALTEDGWVIAKALKKATERSIRATLQLV